LINYLVDYDDTTSPIGRQVFSGTPSRRRGIRSRIGRRNDDDLEATMPVTLNPYLNFRDNAREAMEFYHSVFGGELNVSTFADYQAAVDPSENELVMHAQLEGPGLTLMGADVPRHMDYNGISGFSVSLSGSNDDDATLRGYWDKLADGGTIVQPLEVAPWGDAFGMLVDRFGVSWLVNIGGAAA
jgi:PhnB protein